MFLLKLIVDLLLLTLFIYIDEIPLISYLRLARSVNSPASDIATFVSMSRTLFICGLYI